MSKGHKYTHSREFTLCSWQRKSVFFAFIFRCQLFRNPKKDLREISLVCEERLERGTQIHRRLAHVFVSWLTHGDSHVLRITDRLPKMLRVFTAASIIIINAGCSRGLICSRKDKKRYSLVYSARLLYTTLT